MDFLVPSHMHYYSSSSVLASHPSCSSEGSWWENRIDFFHPSVFLAHILPPHATLFTWTRLCWPALALLPRQKPSNRVSSHLPPQSEYLCISLCRSLHKGKAAKLLSWFSSKHTLPWWLSLESRLCSYVSSSLCTLLSFIACFQL